MYKPKVQLLTALQVLIFLCQFYGFVLSPFFYPSNYMKHAQVVTFKNVNWITRAFNHHSSPLLK